MLPKTNMQYLDYTITVHFYSSVTCRKSKGGPPPPDADMDKQVINSQNSTPNLAWVKLFVSAILQHPTVY